MKEIKYSDVLNLWNGAKKVLKSDKISIDKFFKYLKRILKHKPKENVGLDLINNQKQRHNIHHMLKALPSNIITKKDYKLIIKNMQGYLSNYNSDNLYKFIKDLKKVIKILKGKKDEIYVDESLRVLEFIYKSAYYEYQNVITCQVDDSEIAVSISVKDMRKELIEDIKNQPSYNYLKNILNEKTDNKLGLQLSSSPLIRSMLINAISNIKTELAKKDEIIEYVGLIDDKKIYNETLQQILDRIKTNTESLLKAIKEEKRKMKDSTLKAFLYYIQKVVSLEYKNKNNIPKRRYYKHTKDIRCDVSLFPSGSPKIEDITQGNLGDCYLLAALMSIIKKNPKYIERCFLNRDSNSLDNVNFVKVRLYKIQVYSKKVDENIIIYTQPIAPIIISVKNSVLIKELGKNKKPKPYGNQTKALWVNFIEKAFSIYRNKNNCITAKNDDTVCQEAVNKFMKSSDHSLSGQNVSGGFDNIALSIITGKESSFRNIDIMRKEGNSSPDFGYNLKEDRVFDYINNCLNNNKIFTVGTFSEGKGGFKTDDEISYAVSKGIYSSHAYSVKETRIDNEKQLKFIILTNPHRITSFAYEKDNYDELRFTETLKPEEAKSGETEVELLDFVKYFKSMSELSGLE